MNWRVAIVALIAFWGVSPLAHAQRSDAAAARRVPPGVGDRWTYEVRDVDRPEKRYRTIFEATSVGPDIIVERIAFERLATIEMRYGPGAYLTGLAPGVVSFSPYLQAFQEPRSGESWKGIGYRYLGVCSGSSQVICFANAQVAGREKVTVPAGSFDAWKVEIDLIQRPLSPAGQAAGYGTVRFTYWFAEEARRYVKFRSRALGHWMQPSVEMELLSYVPADPK